MLFRVLLLASCLLGTAGASLATQPDAAEPFRTVLLVRHAEKVDDSKDPELSETGHQRAQRLAELTSTWRITHVYSSEFTRTQDTVVPMAREHEVEIQVVSAFEQGKLIAALESMPAGSVAVVSGHSNTVPAIAKDLGGNPRIEQLPHEEYDLGFVLTWETSESTPTTVQIDFREPNHWAVLGE